jgi:AbrB family looped-hinge helix DNA binding protein
VADFTVKSGSFRPGSIKFSVSVDSKGRISIPSSVRKTLGINAGENLQLLFLIDERRLVLTWGGKNEI